MNTVILIGNVTRDPETRHTSSGKAVSQFTIAVPRGRGGDQADFFTVIAWERQAEIVEQYVRKGTQVGVDGRLQYSTWEKDGQKRSKVEVVANYIQLLGGPREDNTEPAVASVPVAVAAPVEDDVPFY